MVDNEPPAPSEGLLIRQYLSRALTYSTATGLGPTLVRSIGGTAIVRIGAMAVSFAVGVQLARALGASDYGYYGMALAIISIAGVPGEMGLPRLVTREVAAAGARKDNGLIFGVLRWADKMSWRISAAMMVVVVIGDLLISGAKLSVLERALILGAPVIPLLTLARIRGGALQGLHHVVRGQVPDVLLRPAILSLMILAFVLAGAKLSPATAMGLNSVAAGIVFVLAHWWLKQRLPPRPAVAEIPRAGKRWLASSVPMGLTDGMRILQSELSILLVGLIALPVGAGLFRIANVTSFMAAMPVSVINFVAFPLIARLHALDDKVKLQHMLGRLALTQFAGVLLLCLPLMLFPEPLLGLVFGSSYMPAANALRILATGQLICSALGPSVALLNMTHHERRVTRAMIVALILNLTLLPVLTYFWGILGAALAVAVSLTSWNLQTWMDGRRLLKLDTSILAAISDTKRAARGVKPNLFIVGAPKCGTTAWMRYLSSHPEIFISEVKETTYFGHDLPGMQWVRSQYHYESLFARGRNCKVVGDASAAHLYSTVAAAEIAKYNPDAKILIFLRDQEDYLPALHNHYLTRFEECVEDFEAAWRMSGKRPPEAMRDSFTEPKLLDYAALGSFHQQVARYYEHFPAEHIRVFHLREWSSNPRAAYLDILKFLGVPDDGRTEFPRVNEAKHFRVKWIGKLIMQPPFFLKWAAALLRLITRRNALHLNERVSEVFATKGYQTKITPEVKAELRRHFEEDNRRLWKLLDQMRGKKRSARATG